MKSPEQQPTAEPEKNPADAGLDIVAAKKYLEEAYGPEKSTIEEKPITTIDVKSTPVSEEQKIKFVPVAPEKTVEKKPIIEVVERVGQPRTPTEVKDFKKIREEGEKTIERKKKIKEKELVAEEKREKGEIPSTLDLAYKRAKKISQEAKEEKKSERVELPPPPKKPVKESLSEKKEFNPLETHSVDTEDIKQRETEPTVAELTKNIKQEKATEEAKVETAKNELIDLAKSIKEAREKKETETETTLYDKIKEVFKIAEEKSFEETVRKRAKEEAEKDGFKIITEKNFREEYKEDETKGKELRKSAREDERTRIDKKCWNNLSAEEKEEYFNQGDDKKNLEAINSARNGFAVKLKEKIDAKIKELGEGKEGLSVSEDTFYGLIDKDLDIDSINIKKIGWRKYFNWGKISSKDKIKILISPLDKKDDRGALKITREDLAEMDIKVKKNIEEVAQEKIERKIKVGKNRWRRKKQRHTREIIQETVTKYEAEKKLKVEPEEEIEKPKIEIVSRIGKERTPKQIKEMEKIRKHVEADIKKSKESKKRIEDLIKKQKKGELLTTKEVAYLRAIEFSRKTKKESER